MDGPPRPLDAGVCEPSSPTKYHCLPPPLAALRACPSPALASRSRADARLACSFRSSLAAFASSRNPPADERQEAARPYQPPAACMSKASKAALPADMASRAAPKNTLTRASSPPGAMKDGAIGAAAGPAPVGAVADVASPRSSTPSRAAKTLGARAASPLGASAASPLGAGAASPPRRPRPLAVSPRTGRREPSTRLKPSPSVAAGFECGPGEAAGGAGSGLGFPARGGGAAGRPAAPLPLAPPPTTPGWEAAAPPAREAAVAAAAAAAARGRAATSAALGAAPLRSSHVPRPHGPCACGASAGRGRAGSLAAAGAGAGAPDSGGALACAPAAPPPSLVPGSCAPASGPAWPPAPP